MEEAKKRINLVKESVRVVFNKFTKKDWVYVIGLVVFIAILTYPNFIPKGDCEVARPGFKCESIKNVMIENCNYWSQFSCDTSKDVSLPQIEWYIQNLCNLQKQKGDPLDCSNLKLVCNQITQTNACPI